MKDAILEILLNKVKATAHDFYPTGIEGLPQSAREIAELMTEFIEWIGLEYGFHSLAIREIDMKWLYPLDLDEDKEYTTNELFTYWHDNVYKK